MRTVGSVGTIASPAVVTEGFVPAIDLTAALGGDAAQRRSTAAAIDAACRTPGFLVVVGHGVDPALVARMHNLTVEFFHHVDAWKGRWNVRPGDPTIRGLYRTGGYVAASAGEETPPDLCELFTMNRLGEPGLASRDELGEGFDTWSAPNIWPDGPAGFREIWLEYYAAMEGLMRELMRLFALGLGLAEHTFDAEIDQHVSNMSANWYPPTDGTALPGQLRKGAHTDWGTLTILHQDGAGLQVLDRDGSWMDVPVVPGAFVVNIGDMMAVWTNDAWVSTVHRVPAPTGELATRPRVSLPFFGMTNWSTRIECLPSCRDEVNPPRHEPITCGEYFLAKLAAAYANS